jgi:hypothetical protein
MVYFSPVKIVNLRGEGDFDTYLLTNLLLYIDMQRKGFEQQFTGKKLLSTSIDLK